MTARRIFVSYSRRDRDVVKSLTDGLTLGGADVFRDEASIEPGEDWAEVLAKNIQTCDKIALFWSANSSVSEQVKTEWGMGLHYQKRIAPILLDKTPLPTELRRFQYIDHSQFVTVTKVPPQHDPRYWAARLHFLKLVAPSWLPKNVPAALAVTFTGDDEARRALINAWLLSE